MNATRAARAGVTSSPFSTTSKVPRSSDGTSVDQSFCTNSARTPSARASASARSTSNPTQRAAVAGSSYTYGSPPCTSPPQRSTPRARISASVAACAGAQKQTAIAAIASPVFAMRVGLGTCALVSMPDGQAGIGKNGAGDGRVVGAGAGAGPAVRRRRPRPDPGGPPARAAGGAGDPAGGGAGGGRPGDRRRPRRSGGARAEIFDEFAESRTELEFLVNDAGFATSGPFAARDLERELAQVQVNVAAVTHLTGLFLPGMVARQERPALEPGLDGRLPAGAVHGDLLRHQGVRELVHRVAAYELRGTGVTATVCCPGATATEFSDVAGTSRSRLFASAPPARPSSPPTPTGR